jgi:tellurite methyltransferase
VPRNWDEHYSDTPEPDWTPAPLLVEIADALAPGRALGIACGAGRNALYLAQLGWDVDAVDASAAAIGLLLQKAAGLRVRTHIADLERGEFAIPAGGYDLVCDFFYLQRNLFPQLREAVRPGGTFLGAIHVRGDPDDTNHNPDFMLAPGELRAEFAGWKIPYYSEAPEPGKLRRTARIVARRA